MCAVQVHIEYVHVIPCVFFNLCMCVCADVCICLSICILLCGQFYLCDCLHVYFCLQVCSCVRMCACVLGRPPSGRSAVCLSDASWQQGLLQWAHWSSANNLLSPSVSASSSLPPSRSLSLYSFPPVSLSLSPVAQSLPPSFIFSFFLLSLSPPLTFLLPFERYSTRV